MERREGLRVGHNCLLPCFPSPALAIQTLAPSPGHYPLALAHIYLKLLRPLQPGSFLAPTSYYPSLSAPSQVLSSKLYSSGKPKERDKSGGNGGQPRREGGEGWGHLSNPPLTLTQGNPLHRVNLISPYPFSLGELERSSEGSPKGPESPPSTREGSQCLENKALISREHPL